MNAESALEADIIECVQRDFPADAIHAVLSKLVAASSVPRIQRCIAFASRGHQSYFDSLCELAKIDYRDVIMAAEYDRLGTQLYDFNQPILKARLDRRLSYGEG